MHQKSPFEFNLQEEFRHLSAAPIEEAVIHWTAKAVKPPIQEEWRDQLQKLPGYPECHPQKRFLLETEINVDGLSRQTQHDSWYGFQLTSSDKLYIAQFNRDGMVFSRLKPYNDWGKFSGEGLKLWRFFTTLAEPSEVQRLGIRFINRIAPIKLSKVASYLTKPPKCLQSLGLPMSNFLFQSTHDVPGHPYKINVVQAIQPPVPKQAEVFGLILDIDVFTTQAFQPTESRIKEHLANMRWLKDKAFFSLLKEKTIASFEETPK